MPGQVADQQLHELQIERRGQMFVFTLRANAFLHHMVRNLIGALVYVGSGKRPPEWLQQVLQAATARRPRPRSCRTACTWRIRLRSEVGFAAAGNGSTAVVSAPVAPVLPAAAGHRPMCDFPDSLAAGISA